MLIFIGRRVLIIEPNINVMLAFFIFQSLLTPKKVQSAGCFFYSRSSLADICAVFVVCFYGSSNN